VVCVERVCGHPVGGGGRIAHGTTRQKTVEILHQGDGRPMICERRAHYLMGSRRNAGEHNIAFLLSLDDQSITSRRRAFRGDQKRKGASRS